LTSNQKREKISDIFCIPCITSQNKEVDYSTPIIIHKADIATVNPHVINSYLANNFIYNSIYNINNNQISNLESTGSLNYHSKFLRKSTNGSVSFYCNNNNNNNINNTNLNDNIKNTDNKYIYDNLKKPNSNVEKIINDPIITNSPKIVLNNYNLTNHQIDYKDNSNNLFFKGSISPKGNFNNTLSKTLCGTDNTIILGNPFNKFQPPRSSCIKSISLEESNKFKTIQSEDETEDLYEIFIKALLKPSEWKLNYLSSLDKNGIPKFRFRREYIIALTKACNEIVLSQKMILRIKTPVKVFGDIHGQFEDLMRFFELWGEPSERPGLGDINSTDYLFLGDYVDRGVNSLETICLLMALKIKYPDKIHLLRGNHEDRLINSNFGFLEECEFRLNETRESDDLNVFEVINEFFDCLPLAAVIDDEILCIHGGLGGCLSKISEIEEIKRPLKIVYEANNKTEQIVMDILWSDPTENDNEFGIQPNLIRDSRNYGNIVKFGPDIVDRFLKVNNLSMIIRAHECVLDGFERFNKGKLITLFSATDYCKRHKNAGAMLVINNNFEIIPHLIYPIIEPNNIVNSNNLNFINNYNIQNMYNNANLIGNNFKNDIVLGDQNNNNNNNNINNYSNTLRNFLSNSNININGYWLLNSEENGYKNTNQMINNDGLKTDINHKKDGNEENINYENLIENISKISMMKGRQIKWIDEIDDFKKRPPTPLRNREYIYNKNNELNNYEN